MNISTKRVYLLTNKTCIFTNQFPWNKAVLILKSESVYKKQVENTDPFSLISLRGGLRASVLLLWERVVWCRHNMPVVWDYAEEGSQSVHMIDG